MTSEAHAGGDGGTTRATDDPELAERYWRAVARLPVARDGALAELAGVFALGVAPTGLDGRRSGRFVTATVGHHLDGPFDAGTRLWMPWVGKVFDASRAEGRNLFRAIARPLLRLSFPGYDDVRDEGGGLCSAFAFDTSVGPSRHGPNAAVMRIDYDREDNPSRPIRQILDELVRLAPDLYLGQALVRRQGRWQRAAWFSFEPQQ